MKYGIHKTRRIDEGGKVETYATGWRIENEVGAVIWFNNEYVEGLVRAINAAAHENSLHREAA